MAINYTTLLGLAQPVPGTEANTWGTVVNDEITALLDSAIAGASTLNVTAGNVTLTDTAGVANQARMAILIATGTPGTTRNIVAPSQSKTYIVINQADASVVLKGSATTGVAIRAGQAATCVWNGADFEIVASGDVDGPSSSTNTAVAIFDGTTGKLIKNTGVTIDGSNNVSGVVQLNATTVDTTNLEVTNLKAKDGTAAGSIADSTGVVTLASSVLTTTDINGGTIDGTTIGASTRSTGAFTTLTSNGATTFTANTASTSTTTGTTVITGGLGVSGRVNASNFDGIVGANTAAAGTFTSLTDSGNLAFTGTGNRITGDFSNATVANRVAFQSSTGTFTSVPFYGPGANQSSSIDLILGNAPTDTSRFQILASTVDARLNAGIYGTGTYVPMTFFTGGSEAMRIDTSRNVGIGTSSPTNALQLVGTAKASSQLYVGSNSDDNYSGGIQNLSNTSRSISIQADPTNAGASTILTFGVDGSERMRIDSSGNVGIGTASPGARLDVTGASGGQDIAVRASASASATLDLAGNGNTVGSTSFTIRQDTSGQALLFNRANTPMLFATNDTERMRIDSSGNLLVGTASTQQSRIVSEANGTSVYGLTTNMTAGSGTRFHIVFRENSSERGSITSAGSGVAYNTTSDYRLKENVAPMTGALQTVAALKPVTYTWKADGSNGQGFIAHELQSVVPDCVTGEKDAVDAEGKPQYQGVDTSFLVATLVSAIQEQQTIITQLQADVAALKGTA